MDSAAPLGSSQSSRRFRHGAGATRRLDRNRPDSVGHHCPEVTGASCRFRSGIRKGSTHNNPYQGGVSWTLRRNEIMSMKINHTVRISILISLSLGAAMAQNATSRIVSAANTFLSTLDQKQRQSVLFAFDDEQQRKRWSNFPISIVPRAGISFKEMNPAQLPPRWRWSRRRSAHEVLKRFSKLWRATRFSRPPRAMGRAVEAGRSASWQRTWRPADRGTAMAAGVDAQVTEAAAC